MGYDHFDRGTLTIDAIDGSSIMLDADTGEISTVNVRVSTDVDEIAIELPWSTWAEQLRFHANLLSEAK